MWPSRLVLSMEVHVTSNGVYRDKSIIQRLQGQRKPAHYCQTAHHALLVVLCPLWHLDQYPASKQETNYRLVLGPSRVPAACDAWWGKVVIAKPINKFPNFCDQYREQTCKPANTSLPAGDTTPTSLGSSDPISTAMASKDPNPPFIRNLASSGKFTPPHLEPTVHHRPPLTLNLPDRKIRTAALASLRTFLSARRPAQYSLTEIDVLKL